MVDLLDRLETLRERLATVAQEVFEEWDFQMGGACDEIAAEIIGVLYCLDNVRARNGAQEGDNHSWVLVTDGITVCGVDIPWQHYERGSGYNWEPLPNARISPEHVEIWETDISPEEV